MNSMTTNYDESGKCAPKIKIAQKGLFIWGLATIFYFFDNLLNVSPSAMKSELMLEFNCSGAALGALASCYLWSYGLMQIPVGILMDKYGPRRLLTVASLSCALGSFVFGWAVTLEMAMLGRLLIGFGASFAVVGCTKIASDWFPAKRFALFIGLMVTIGMLGAAFGLSTVNLIVTQVGWRQAMCMAAVVGIIIAIMLWSLVRDKESASNIKVKNRTKINIFKDVMEVVKCPQAWIASSYAGLMFVPTLAFGALWGVPFLIEAHGYLPMEAGSIVSLIFIGWACGGPLFGWVSDHIGKRNLPMYIANITTLATTLMIVYLPDISVPVMGLLMCLLGFCSSGFIIAFAVIKEKNRPELSGTAVGFINTLNTFGGAFFQYIIGRVLDSVSTGTIDATTGERLYTLHEYQEALIALPVCLIISLVILFFLKETNCRSSY